MPPRFVTTSGCHVAKTCNKCMKPLSFSTSSLSFAQIPPESPRFIEIPRPVQPVQPFPIHMKGVLPVPRPVFRQRPRPHDPDKASAEYLANTTPEPINDNTTSNSQLSTADFVSWKARQAEARRRNLREGLVELNQRKQKTDRYLEARGKRKQAERERLLAAPELEDERLTNPSVLQSERATNHRVLSDPTREIRLAQKRDNVAKTEARGIQERRNRLHNLYVNSSHFITTPKQLDAVVDGVFDNLDQFTTDQKPGLNIWNLGLPETVSELLSKDPRKQKALDSADGNARLTKERMRRISEELTGGKMGDIS